MVDSSPGRPFMARPTDVYRDYLRGVETFLNGRLAMAMECITVVRALEDLPVADEGVKAAVCAAFETLLVDQGLMDAATALYEMLVEWRKPRFVAVASEEELALWPVGDGVAGGLELRDRSQADGAFRLDVPPKEVAPEYSSGESPVLHRGLDALTRHELEELRGAAVEETWFDESK